MLRAAVERDDVQAVAAHDGLGRRPRAVRLRPLALPVGLDRLHPVGPGHRRGLPRPGHHRGGVSDDGGVGREHRPHRAGRAQAADEGAGVDAGQAGDAVFLQVLVERAVGAVVRVGRRQLLDDEAGDVGAGALAVVGVDAVVADQGVGHRDDLALVRRVGERLLVAVHRGVEDRLGLARHAGRAERAAGEDRAVLQREGGGRVGRFVRIGRHGGDDTSNRTRRGGDFSRHRATPRRPTAPRARAPRRRRCSRAGTPRPPPTARPRSAAPSRARTTRTS